jgi:protein-L-isoaspartate O-methyltransferase
MSFLNIGSGTGYFSMLAGYIVSNQGTNHGVELRANLVEHANDCCDEFFTYFPKLKKQICYPQFIAGNCFHIDATAHKYDRLYCGAACPRERFGFLLELVKPGGLVVVPSGNKVCTLCACLVMEEEAVFTLFCVEFLVAKTGAPYSIWCQGDCSE